MATSSVTYPGDGATLIYSVPFPYILTTHVQVYVNGMLQPTPGSYTWPSASSIQFKAAFAPGNGAVIYIRRVTPLDSRLVTFIDGASLTEADLNLNTSQLLYGVQEVIDAFNNIIAGTYTNPSISLLASAASSVLSTAAALEVQARINDIDAAGQLLLDAMMQRRVLGEPNDVYSRFKLATGTIELDETGITLFNKFATIATDTSLLAQNIALLGARNGAGTAFILDVNTVQLDSITHETMASRLSVISADAAANAAAISSEATTRAASIISEASARTTADSAIAASVTSLTATVSSNAAAATAAIASEASTRATADTAISTSVTNLSSVVTTNAATAAASVASEASTRASADTAISSTVTSLIATVATNTADIATNVAAIATEATARVSGDSANASSITALTSTVSGHTSTLTTLAATDVTLAGGITTLNARYGVALNVDGFVSGFTLNSSGGSGSSFDILTNKFRVVDPGPGAGATPVSVFTISGGNVYLQNLFINGSLLVAGTVTATHLNVSTLSAITATMGALTMNGDITVSAGRIVFDNGTYMRVSGVGFGTSSQFLDWYGPTMAISACSESNALYYLAIDGTSKYSSQWAASLTVGSGTNGGNTIYGYSDASTGFTPNSFGSMTSTGSPAGNIKALVWWPNGGGAGVNIVYLSVYGYVPDADRTFKSITVNGTTFQRSANIGFNQSNGAVPLSSWSFTSASNPFGTSGTKTISSSYLI